MIRMATEATQVFIDESASAQAPSAESAAVVEGREGEITGAWLCPLVKKLCTDIAEPPGKTACRDCTIHKIWHTADNVDPRFWN
jgi:hypothetical protein